MCRPMRLHWARILRKASRRTARRATFAARTPPCSSPRIIPTPRCSHLRFSTEEAVVGLAEAAGTVVLLAGAEGQVARVEPGERAGAAAKAEEPGARVLEARVEPGAKAELAPREEQEPLEVGG